MSRRFVTVYVVRHGVTAWNDEGRIVGHSDMGLSERGLTQAEGARSLLARCRLDLVLTSPLKRTRETARCLAQGREVEVEEDERLVELALGDWEGRTRAELRHDPAWEQWIASPHTTSTPEGETLDDVRDRSVGSLDDGVQFVPAGGGLAIVTHGGVARVLILHLLGMPLSAYHKVRCDCASVSAFEVTTEGVLHRLLALNLSEPLVALSRSAG